jgi:hypothetical protein
VLARGGGSAHGTERSGQQQRAMSRAWCMTSMRASSDYAVRCKREVTSVVMEIGLFTSMA